MRVRVNGRNGETSLEMPSFYSIYAVFLYEVAWDLIYFEVGIIFYLQKFISQVFSIFE